MIEPCIWVVLHEQKAISPSIALELTLGETLATSKPNTNTFGVEDQYLEGTIEENPNQNQNRLINQPKRRMKLREYSDPIES